MSAVARERLDCRRNRTIAGMMLMIEGTVTVDPLTTLVSNGYEAFTGTLKIQRPNVAARFRGSNQVELTLSASRHNLIVA